MATAVIEQPKIESEPTLADSLMKARRRITVEEYHRIVDSGVFGPEPKVELLEGVIVEKMTKNRLTSSPRTCWKTCSIISCRAAAVTSSRWAIR